MLESALSRAYDACEKKADEAITELSFKGNVCEVCAKGAFTYYEESFNMDNNVDEECAFCLKLSSLLEFVKYSSTEELLMVYDSDKKTCIISSTNKKSKIAFSTVDASVRDPDMNPGDVSFVTPNMGELLHRLNIATKFCYLTTLDYPLTAIHCLVSGNKFEIKSTNGAAFYKYVMDKAPTEQAEIYIPRKAPPIIRNVFKTASLKKMSIGPNSVLFESDTAKLKVFLEKSEYNSFPTQILQWAEKTSDIKVKVSLFELQKTLKLFSGIYTDPIIKVKVDDGKFELECKENSVASKEVVVVEESSGTAESNYDAEFFLNCIESIESPWVELEFIPMQESYYLCKFSHSMQHEGATLSLLAPII